MIPGDVQRISKTSNTGLHQIRKPRFARRESTILGRMFADGAGIPPLSSHLTPEVMRSRFNENQRWQDDLNRSTSLSSSDLLSASSSSSFSEDRSAGKSTVDDEASVSGGKNKRSTATTAYGVISLMGRRREMEDAVTAIPSLSETLGSECPHSFFAVYDGNGGFGVAEKRKERLHHLVAEQLAEEIGDLTMDDMESRIDWERVMKQSFASMDKEVFCGKEVESSGSGERNKVEGNKTRSTALVAVVGVEEIVVANCGHSMAVLCQAGVAIPLSRPHKSGILDERERLEAAGGRVVDYHGPPDFATSSSIEVNVYRRTQSDEFLILASDGLWDVVSSDMACEIVKRFLLHEQCRRMKVCTEEEDDSYGEDYATHTATMLAEMAISRGSKDNVSIAVIMLC